MSLTGRFLVCALLLAALLGGCKTIERADPRKRAAEERAQQLQRLQLEVMRFADEYAGRSREVIVQFQAGLQNPDQRLLAQNWKVQQASAAYTIASGPNPLSNALDMVVLASLSRMVIDDTWVSVDHGAPARSVQETYRSLEAEAWKLVEGVLNREHVDQLHQLIAQWRAKHPDVRSVAYIHFRDFAQGGAPGAESASAGSLLSIVGIDPLSNLDPAVKEIAQTRQLAERAIYYMQRAPDLLDMQVERLSYQFAAMPESRTLLTSVDRVSLVGSASNRLVDNLPDLLDRERQALVAQLTETLNSQSATLGTLAGQLRDTLQAGTDTATAVNGALQSFERISGQFARKPQAAAAAQPEQPRPPFDIRHYTAMLEQAAVTARELENLAQHGDALAPVLRSATQDAGLQLRGVLNHLFLLLVLLVLVIAAAALLAALAYRRLSRRFAHA